MEALVITKHALKLNSSTWKLAKDENKEDLEQGQELHITSHSDKEFSYKGEE